MAKYAEECGYMVPDAELAACQNEQADAPKETSKTCSQYNGNQDLRLEWTCDELEEYWGEEADSDTDA
jgi:hypothetical protein